MTQCALKQALYEMIDESQNLSHSEYHGFIGASKPMQALYQMIEQVALTQVSVFITGESGTGKELCAEAIHKQSQRKEKPFIVVNCAALPKDLIESQLFGHIKGAFTGAVANRDGTAKTANFGTLFLDEIAEMDSASQARLLRLVQNGTFYAVGSDIQEQVDIRLICATNRDIRAEVKAKRFREDLYHRLNVIDIKMPALRERSDDILRLARHFRQPLCFGF
jgi:two-component system, repressor protein LuxO